MVNQALEAFIKGIPALNKRFLLEAQSHALAFFDDSFQNQGFTGRIFIRWKPRKTAGQPGKNDNNRGARFGQPQIQGRAIGIKSGALRRSGMGGVNDTGIWISYGNQDVPYAKAFSTGKRDQETVKAHSRTSRKGKTYQVRTFTRTPNQPPRPIIGQSPVLMAELAQLYFNGLRTLKAKTQGRIPQS
jgi:hypothetical protein